MKRLLSISGIRQWLLCAVVFGLLAPASQAATVCVSQSGGTDSSAGVCNGLSTTAIGSVSWTSGNTYILTGTITSTFKVNANNVTLLFDTGAVVSAACNGGSGASCISATGLTGLLIDGNNSTSGSPCGWINQAEVSCNGQVEASNPTQTSGSAFGIDVTSSCVEIRNLQVGPIYNATANGTQPGGDIRGIQFLPSNGSCSTGPLIHNNIIHDVSSGIVYVPNGSTDSGMQAYNNYEYNNNSHFDLSNNNNGTLTKIVIHDEYGGATGNWDGSGCPNHHNFFHAFANTLGNSNLYLYNNTISGNWGLCPTGAIFFDNTYNPGDTNCIVFNNYISTTYTNTSGGNSITGSCNGTSVFFSNTYLGDSGSGDWCVSMGSQSGASSVWTYENNAIGNCNGELIFTNSPATIYALIDYNSYEGSTSGTPWGVNCSSGCSPYYSFSGWQGAGFDTHGRYNSSTTYFNLTNGVPQTGSPLIHAGLPASTLNTLCTGLGISGNPCLKDLTGATRPTTGDVTAGAFEPSGSTYTITVPAITGNGNIQSSDSVIGCAGNGGSLSGTCTDSTASGTVTLSATPSSGYTYGSWGGGSCSGSDATPCSVTGTATVTASFTLAPSAPSLMLRAAARPEIDDFGFSLEALMIRP